MPSSVRTSNSHTTLSDWERCRWCSSRDMMAMCRSSWSSFLFGFPFMQ